MRWRRTIGRLAVAPLGVLFGWLLLEAGLHGGALILAMTGREAPKGWTSQALRVLCVGDSNTYGLFLSREEAYPHQLERIWNRTFGSPRIEVLNVGFPGTNSSRLRTEYRRMLDTFKPDVVLLLIGANDFWTLPVPIDPVRDERSALRRFVESHSRVYRLFDILRRGKEVELTYDVSASAKEGASKGSVRYGDREFSLGWTRADWEAKDDGSVALRNQELGEDLETNLRALGRQTQNAGAGFVLMTYAAGHSAPALASGFIRSAARADELRLIDLRRVFEPICPEPDCPEFFLPDRAHPNAQGYRLIAETVAAELQQWLRRAD